MPAPCRRRTSRPCAASATRPTRLAIAVAAALGGVLAHAAPEGVSDAPATDELPIVSVTGARDLPEGYLPAVTTTGSKIAVPLRDLPASVTVVPREVITEQASTSLGQVVSNASGVQPLYGGGYGFADAFTIRGLRARFLRDGLPDGPPLLNYARRFADVESVEVLKGPGSALYGNGAPGGVINLVGKAPQRRRQAYGELAVGGLGLRQASADVTGPLGEAWAGRLIANDQHADGIRGLESDVRELVAKLEWRGAGQRLAFGWDHRENRNVVDNYGILFDVQGRMLPVSRDTRYHSPFNRVAQDLDRVSVVHETPLAPALSLRSALVHDWRRIDVARNAGGNPVNAAGAFTGRNGRVQDDDARYTNLSSELTWKLAGPVTQTILVGAELERVRNDSARSTYALPSIANALAPVVPETSLDALAKTRTFDKTVGSDTVSLYAQDHVELTSQWKARAGVRVDRAHWFDRGFGNSLTVPTVANVLRELDVRDTLPSWQLGMVYQPHPAVSLFGGVTRGRFISVQTESVNLDRLPESSRQVELGAKTSWLDERLQVNVTGFDTRREDYLVALTPGTDPVAAGRSKSRGVELDVIGTPLPGWNVTASASRVNARSTGSEVATVTGIGAESVNGKLLAATPRQAWSFWTAYTLPSGPLQGLGGGVGATHKGDTFVDAIEKLRVPGYTVWQAAVFYRLGWGEVAVNVRNLTNRSYFVVPTFSGALPGEPRQVLLTLRAHL